MDQKEIINNILNRLKDETFEMSKQIQYALIFSINGKKIRHFGYVNEEEIIEIFFDEKIVQPFLIIMERYDVEYEPKHVKATYLFTDKTEMFVDMYFGDLIIK